MTCAYMPDGSTFNGQQSLLPEDYFNSLQLGDVLNNDALHRLVWHARLPRLAAKQPQPPFSSAGFLAQLSSAGWHQSTRSRQLSQNLARLSSRFARFGCIM